MTEKFFLSQIYGMPILPKAGLGNMLIPLAECLLWCKDNNIQMIEPTWFKFRLGPFLRNEIDKRNYHIYFKSSKIIENIKKFFLLLISKKIPSHLFDNEVVNLNRFRPTIIQFSDIYHFSRLVGRSTEVNNYINEIVREKYKPVFHDESPFVGVHIRFGDFPSLSNLKNKNQVFFRLPIEWYVECINELRLCLGYNIKVMVFSDGKDEELTSIFRLPNTYRSNNKHSISDLLLLSHSSIIITSRSTFSLWGVYLGQVPSIWYPPKKDISGDRIIDSEIDTNYEIEWMPGDRFSDNFIQNCLNEINMRIPNIRK